MTMTPSPITCRAFIDDFARGMDEMVEMPLADARKRYAAHRWLAKQAAVGKLRRQTEH